MVGSAARGVGRIRVDGDRLGRGRARADRRPSARLGYCAVWCGAVAVVLALVPAGRPAAAGLAVPALLLAVVARRRARAHGRTDAGPARLAVGLGLFVGIAVLAFQAATGAAPSRAPVFTVAASVPLEPGVSGSAGSDDLTVRIGRMNVLTDWQGVPQAALPVVVTNVSERVRAFDIEFEAADARGTILTRDSAYVAPLAPGDSAHLTVFEIIDRRLVSQLTSAVVEVAGATWYEF